LSKDQIISNLPEWFRVKDTEALLEARGFLALHIAEVTEKLRRKEVEHPKVKAERKLTVMSSTLAHSGTVQEREAKAHDECKDLIMREAKLEGEIKGLRHYVESMKEVTNAIAAYLKQTT